MEKPPRILIQDETVEGVINQMLALIDNPAIREYIILRMREKLEAAFAKHGRGACWTMQEAVGMADEEMGEVKAAAHKNDLEEFEGENIDLMIAAMWNVASIRAGVINGKW